TSPIPVMTTRSMLYLVSGVSCRRGASLAATCTSSRRLVSGNGKLCQAGNPRPKPSASASGLGELREPSPRRGSAAVLLDVIDSVLDGADFLRVLVRDVDLEGLLEGEHELDQAERVRS